MAGVRKEVEMNKHLDYQFFQQFLKWAVYDVLVTPVNLHRWAFAEAEECALYGGRATLDRILSSCQEALSEGR